MKNLTGYQISNWAMVAVVSLSLANCTSKSSEGLATEVTQASYGPVNIQTACVANGRTIDQANPFSPTNISLFANHMADISDFYLYPELRAEPTIFGRLEDQLVLEIKQINDSKVEVWVGFIGPFPGYCAHIVSSTGAVFDLSGVQGASFQMPSGSLSDERTRNIVNDQINDCMERTAGLDDLQLFPRDCSISVEVGGNSTGEGCACFDAALAIPARTVRLILETDAQLIAISITGSEVIVETFPLEIQ